MPFLKVKPSHLLAALSIFVTSLGAACERAEPPPAAVIDNDASTLVANHIETDLITPTTQGTCDDYTLNNEEIEVDCGGPNCVPCTTFSKSCKALLLKNPAAPSAVYQLDPDASGPAPTYWAYCEMQANGGGWTLALKTDGATGTFSYYSAIWTNDQTLNPAATGLDTTEAKLESFIRIPARALRIGLKQANQTRWLTMPLNVAPAKTLLDIFSHQYTIHTQAGRKEWLNLIDRSVLQPACNEEGLNLVARNQLDVGVRIGILGDDDNTCVRTDSYVGIGAHLTISGCTQFKATTGAGATCDSVAFTDLPAYGYVMVRE